MSQCIFNSENDEYKSCKYYKKYGDYCYKHRRNYLINKDKIINSRRFTGLSKDYLKEDLLYYYKPTVKFFSGATWGNTPSLGLNGFCTSYKTLKTASPSSCFFDSA